MIAFIKANSTILIFILLLFFLFDSFLLAIKFKNYLEALPNIKISYDIFKSYCFGFFTETEGEHSLAIINLTLENTSTKLINITRIRLIDGDKSYLATLPKIRNNYNENELSLVNEDESELININILSENLLKNPRVSPQNILAGYAVFENVEPITDTKSYTIVIETPKKAFEKEIIINPLNTEFHPL